MHFPTRRGLRHDRRPAGHGNRKSTVESADSQERHRSDQSHPASPLDRRPRGLSPSRPVIAFTASCWTCDPPGSRALLSDDVAVVLPPRMPFLCQRINLVPPKYSITTGIGALTVGFADSSSSPHTHRLRRRLPSDQLGSYLGPQRLRTRPLLYFAAVRRPNFALKRAKTLLTWWAERTVMQTAPYSSKATPCPYV
jgi:hypothetical protein